MNQTSEILLVRHAEVEARWKGICYGSLDVSLSTAGKYASDQMAAQLLETFAPSVVYHSGLGRTRHLADRVTTLGGNAIDARKDIRLRERNYGQWQGQSWDSAYNSDPDHFHDLIEKPATYRPPDGETTLEMQQRMVSWLNDQNDGVRVLAISHSGPIAAMAGYLRNLHATEWGPWMTKNLEAIRLKRSGGGSSPWLVERCANVPA